MNVTSHWPLLGPIACYIRPFRASNKNIQSGLKAWRPTCECGSSLGFFGPRMEPKCPKWYEQRVVAWWWRSNVFDWPPIFMPFFHLYAILLASLSFFLKKNTNFGFLSFYKRLIIVHLKEFNKMANCIFPLWIRKMPNLNKELPSLSIIFYAGRKQAKC